MQTVPPTVSERQRLRQLINDLPAERTPSKSRLEELAKTIIADDSHTAWTMVLIGSHFWRQQVIAVPFHRRLLLLPHCLKNKERCTAKYNADGLQCENCGQCPLGNLKTFAESLHYQVLIAEGSPAVLQRILNGKAGAVLGVGCLDSLEKSFDKLQMSAVPALAVPLHTAACQEETGKPSATDLDWVIEMIQTPYKEDADTTKETGTITPASLGKLFHSLKPNTDSHAAALAFDVLTRGGKFYRPFITLSVYNALNGDNHSLEIDDLPDWIKNTVRTIEVFHKASLIHDDVEDDDPFRYGQATLHRTHGIAAAINAGDYLIGYGYQLLAELRHSISSDIVTEMFAVLSQSHCRLCSGQGAELYWTQRKETPPPPDVLKFYVEKTSPAFESALYLGVLAAIQSGGTDWDFYRRHQPALYRLAKHLGAAFQIRNDLDDWKADSANKIVTGGDALRNRPTLLRSLAAVREADRKVITSGSVEELHRLFVQREIFTQAEQLIRQFSAKSREAVQTIEHPALQKLLNQFIETITG
ncbi:MAG: polyprenyl synthetase family protein [Planctomycetaceae bacterium]|jgi:geranylgeranyl pyrophosphate synthase|nr:polyprenyl synthetase family protein [Planctomycetaceae bacterium]